MKSIVHKTRSDFNCKTDICSTCVHYPGCSFRNLSTTSIFFCEEFKLTPDWTESDETGKVRSARDTAWTDLSSEEADESTLMGLCRNCANRRTCVYPKLPGGVWHCDEYA